MMVTAVAFVPPLIRDVLPIPRQVLFCIHFRTPVKDLPLDCRAHSRIVTQPAWLSLPPEPTQARPRVLSHESEEPLSPFPHPNPLLPLQSCRTAQSST